MLDRVLLDNDDFRVTVGLLGGIVVMVKRRQVKVEALPEERTYILDVMETLQTSGLKIEPGNEIDDEVMRDFANAGIGRGGWLWQMFFTLVPPGKKAAEYIR